MHYLNKPPTTVHFGRASLQIIPRTATSIHLGKPFEHCCRPLDSCLNHLFLICFHPFNLLRTFPCLLRCHSGTEPPCQNQLKLIKLLFHLGELLLVVPRLSFHSLGGRWSFLLKWKPTFQNDTEHLSLSLVIPHTFSFWYISIALVYTDWMPISHFFNAT